MNGIFFDWTWDGRYWFNSGGVAGVVDQRSSNHSHTGVELSDQNSQAVHCSSSLSWCWGSF